MSTIANTRVPLHTAPDYEPVNYINAEKGLWSWLTTLDHKRIGVMYLICVLTAFMLGGFFALALRTEHLTTAATAALDKGTIMGPEIYNQMFTLHGAVMVFMFIIPGIPAALGNFVLPLMLGAKDVAFPRLNLLSWYCWVGGATFFMITLVSGGLDTGWTFYTPYSIRYSNTAVVSATFGAFILGFSSILTGVNFLSTVHMLRAKGLTWFKLPLFVWALYSTAVIQILATPVLAITLLLLMAEKILHIGIFDPALGGDPVLYQHFFWFYSHPAVYIMILPAMGVVSELIGTYCHKQVFGYKFIAFSSIAIAILGFLVWGHHLFVSGQSTLAGVIFSFITFFIAIPSAIKVFNWLATMYKGSIDLKVPMLYAMAFIWVFSIGGLTGLPLATMATDIHLTDTYFVIAHFHYVMVGGTVFAFLGGLHHWWPKMFGKMYNEKVSVVAFLLIFIGFNLTFFPQFIMGMQGMPRRYWHYDPVFHAYHFASTMGAYMQGVGFVTLAGVLLQSLVGGKRAPLNPWGAATMEWQASSPPVTENFKHAPVVGDPYDYTVIEWDAAKQTYVRVAAPAYRDAE
jgi:cytochrome c oxidase subunit 1